MKYTDYHHPELVEMAEYYGSAFCKFLTLRSTVAFFYVSYYRPTGAARIFVYNSNPDEPADVLNDVIHAISSGTIRPVTKYGETYVKPQMGD